MKNLNNFMTAVTLLAVLVMGAISANAGVLLGDRSVSSEPCSTKQVEGIIVAGYTGIIVAGLTGIIVAGRDGIIVAGRDGIIVAGRTETCQDQSRDGVLLAD